MPGLLIGSANSNPFAGNVSLDAVGHALSGGFEQSRGECGNIFKEQGEQGLGGSTGLTLGH